MAESVERMATFGETYVETQIMSENNSVAFKFEVAAGVPTSSPPNYFVKFQNNLFGDQTRFTGVALIEINAALNTIVSRKNFLLTESEGSANNAFILALNSLTNNLYILVTDGAVKTSQAVTDKMRALGSVLWPEVWSNKLDFGYVGYLSGTDKKIASENITLNDKRPRGDIRPRVEVVYDKADDVGAQGYADRAVEDEDEVITTTLAEFKRYPTNGPSVPLSTYGIKPGSSMLLSADLFADTAIYTSGQTVRLNLRWFNGTTYLSGVIMEAVQADKDKWKKHYRYLDVPSNATHYTIIASRVGAGTGKAGVRNLVFTEVSRSIEAMSQNAAIGVNGIRMNAAVEGYTPLLLILPDTKSDMSGEIRANEFREYPTV
ncbi:long tail fiber protein proximal connector [Pseudomonas phage PspYZU05]|uniref:Hinge connector of long tail fiber, proximal connector n=1 Tax=Pseudomonas phage PspYZU05 TaxID=1983556 RepID=A0A2U7NS15_9CAUD|nr:long tail fiber protein proximal connector [Pseudomonas phage PspYZU05]ASD52112.1 hinge connector of long tail fiber, proximal connector [Pseudomonas phage PspYZU05]